MTTSSKSCSGWCSSFGRVPFPSPSLLRNTAIKGTLLTLMPGLLLCASKTPRIQRGTDCRQKAILPRRGRIALSANERIAEFLNFAIQAKFAYVNKLNPRIQQGSKRDHLLSSPRREGLLATNGENHLAAAAVGMRCTVRQTAVSSRQSIGNCITFFMMRIGRSAACDGP